MPTKNIFMRFLTSLIVFLIGLGLINYTHTLVNTFGAMGWAEQRLGGGGTYTFWKLLGLALIVYAFARLLGIL